MNAHIDTMARPAGAIATRTIAARVLNARSLQVAAKVPAADMDDTFGPTAAATFDMLDDGPANAWWENFPGTRWRNDDDPG